jgi:hypothetical protein
MESLVPIFWLAGWLWSSDRAFIFDDIAPSRADADSNNERRARGRWRVRYLGGMSGSGMLTSNGKQIARATYDFDCYFNKQRGACCSGQIQSETPILKDVFGLRDIQLLTDDGRRLDITFSAKDLTATSRVAHVDVTGDLPTVD